MNWDKFNSLNISLTEKQKQQLTQYKDLIKSTNEKFNLTTILNDQEILDKHFYDSLIFTKVFNPEDLKILDIGTGAGFPGLVLKIIFPNTKIFLLEANGKKITFLNKVIKQLELNDIWTINERAEIYTREKKENFDVIISRAMAPLNILLEVGVQGLKINGTFICLKAKKVDDEIKELNNSEKEIGLTLSSRQEIEEEGLGIRNNLFYTKTKSTLAIFPRSYSQITKRPLGK